MVKNGKHISDYHDILTDHKLSLNRYRCKKCNYESGSTVLKLLGTTLPGDLMRFKQSLGVITVIENRKKYFQNSLLKIDLLIIMTELNIR